MNFVHNNVKLLFLLLSYEINLTRIFCIILPNLFCMISVYVAAQTPMQKIIQNPLQQRTCIIMSYFVEFVHTFDRFFLFY